MSLETKRKEYLRHMESPEFLADEKAAVQKAETLKKELAKLEFEGLTDIQKFRTSIQEQVKGDIPPEERITE